MATWGVLSGSCSQNTSRYFPKVYWKQISQSIENNTTTIRVYSVVQNDGSTYDWNGTCSSWSLVVNGVTRTLGSFTSNSDSGWTYPSGWTDGSNVVTTNKTELIPESGTTYQDFTITHNADGTKSVSLSHTYSLSSGGWGPGNVSVSGTITLNTIPRATQPTVNYSSRDMGLSISIGTDGASSSFTHKLYYAFTGISKTLITTVAAGVTSYSWTIPLATLAPKIPSTTSGTVTIYADTYSGSTLVGSKTVTFTATVPSSVVPTVSIGKSGVDLYSGDYVQTKSKVAVTLTDAGAYGSTISSRSTTVNGATYTLASFTTGVLTGSGTVTISTTISDSRGRTATASTSITVVAYSTPSASSLSAIRCDSGGTEDPTGEYMKLTGTFSIASINSTNIKSMTLRYAIAGSGSWSTAATDTANYSGSISAVVAADGNSSFDVELVVVDYYSSATRAASVGTAFVLMDFHSSGNSMAIGKVAEGNGLLEIGGDLVLTGGSITAQLISIYVPGGFDLNDLTTPGMYYNPSNAQVATMSNTPYANAFSMLVEKHAGVKQTFTIYSNSNISTWVRNYYNGTWGSWYQVNKSNGTPADHTHDHADITLADFNSAATPRAVGVIMGTGSPPTASSVPWGTIYLKYT